MQYVSTSSPAQPSPASAYIYYYRVLDGSHLIRSFATYLPSTLGKGVNKYQGCVGTYTVFLDPRSYFRRMSVQSFECDCHLVTATSSGMVRYGMDRRAAYSGKSIGLLISNNAE